MSKVEQMGIPPSQVSHHMESYSSPKQKTPEETCECGTEGIGSGLPEQKNKLGSESVPIEPGKNIGALQSTANKTLHLSFEHVNQNCCTEGWKVDSGSEGEHTKYGDLCMHSDHSKERNTETLRTEFQGIDTKLSSDPVNTLQSFPGHVDTLIEHSGHPCGKAGNDAEVDESSTSRQLLKLPSSDTAVQQPHNTIRPGSRFVSDELAESSSGVSGHVAGYHSALVPEVVTKSSVELHGLISDESIILSASRELELPHVHVNEHSNNKQSEALSKAVVRKSSSVKLRVKKTPRLLRKKYILRSSSKSNRVLRSRSLEKAKASQSNQNVAIANSTGERKRKRTKISKGKKSIDDEYSRIRKHLRYILNRMNYEQSLISAYSGEGWKGLSLEKIKPEKELQRATSEILRCKSKIRDLFQKIDFLCAEGRFSDSLFDSDGQIDSEDIFCAKCGSKELTTDNDIILCDGACDRGFHQFCLAPPLLKEDIPPDDEGWLCPGCDCKVDCLDLLNDSQGTDLSISDNWEKVFPEAVSGKNGDPSFGLPSDDSDDNDYDPNGPEIDESSQGDDSSSDESDSTSASEALEASHDQNLGLPSDDSEDDDYDPDAPDVDENLKMGSSSSDFTSDSDDLTTALGNSKLSGVEECSRDSSGKRSNSGGRHSLSTEMLSVLDPDICQDGSAPVSGKRNIERLDYKKLYDETYGNASSDSSDDEEDYTDTNGPSKRKKKSRDDIPVSLNGNPVKGMDQNPEEAQQMSARRTRRKSDIEIVKKSPTKPQNDVSPRRSNDKRVNSPYGESARKRLHSAFKENQYPDRPTKESLAKELGLTFQQVDKWFGNARWSFTHSSSVATSMARSTLEKGESAVSRGSKRLVEQEARRNMSALDGALRQESTKVGESVTGSRSVDVKNRKLKNQESNKQKYKTRKSRRR